MIKRTMYFYDEKQADLIKKVNDKLHKKRGVRVRDVSVKKVADNNKVFSFEERSKLLEYYTTTRGAAFSFVTGLNGMLRSNISKGVKPTREEQINFDNLKQNFSEVSRHIPNDENAFFKKPDVEHFIVVLNSFIKLLNGWKAAKLPRRINDFVVKKLDVFKAILAGVKRINK